MLDKLADRPLTLLDIDFLFYKGIIGTGHMIREYTGSSGWTLYFLGHGKTQGDVEPTAGASRPNVELFECHGLYQVLLCEICSILRA